MAETTVNKIPTSLLDFDPENPRFSRTFGSTDQPPEEVLVRMIKMENIQDLMGSIGEQGYFDGEPLLITPNRNVDGRFVVVEGNRRLAALKLLNEEFEPSPPLPTILDQRANALHRPTEVACIVFSERKEILRYLGYRHITGAKRWDPLSKARYLDQLRQTFYSSLPENDQLRGLAREIGSRPDYVAQMLSGLNVFEKAKANNFYGLQLVREEDVGFSLLTTALSYTSIAKYIGLESRTDIKAGGLNEEHARDLLSWMFAQDQMGGTILGESRNLKLLAAIVDNETALAVLRKTHNLNDAYIRTEGPSESFSNVLQEAYKNLLGAHDILTSIDRFGIEHSKILQKIADLASDLDLIVQKGIRKQSREVSEDA
jgi:hypothetical protein